MIENVQDYNALLVDEIKNNYILKDIQTSTFKELILKITKIWEIYHINEIVSLIIKELKNKKVKINSTWKTPIKTISSTITRDSKNEFSMKWNYKFERIK